MVVRLTYAVCLSQSVAIVLPATKEEKEALAGSAAITLTYQGKNVAIVRKVTHVAFRDAPTIDLS